jgi:hypothetical protein
VQKLWGTDDVGTDAFTTDVAEEFITLFGEPNRCTLRRPGHPRPLAPRL